MVPKITLVSSLIPCFTITHLTVYPYRRYINFAQARNL